MTSEGTIHVQTASDAVGWSLCMQELNAQTDGGESLSGRRLSKAVPRSWWGLCFADSHGRARSHHVLPGVAGDDMTGNPYSNGRRSQIEQK